MEMKSSTLYSEEKKVVWIEDNWEAGERSCYWLMTALKSPTLCQSWNTKGNGWETLSWHLHQPEKKWYYGSLLSFPPAMGPSPQGQYLLRPGKSVVLEPTGSPVLHAHPLFLHALSCNALRSENRNMPSGWHITIGEWVHTRNPSKIKWPTQVLLFQTYIPIQHFYNYFNKWENM